MKRYINRNLYILFLLFSLIFIPTVAWSNYQFINNYGVNANGAQFVILDKGYQLWVCVYDQNSVRVFHPNGSEAPFSPITRGRNSSGALVNIYQPSGIAIDTAGIIYISCESGGNRNIFKFQSWDGTPLNGFEPSFRPGNISIDSSNNLYIVEKVSNNARARFFVLDTAGNNIIGSPVSVSSPTTGTYINRGIGVQTNGAVVYIASETEGIIWRFTGSVANNTANFSTGSVFISGLNQPGAVDVNRLNQLFVSETNNDSVRIYNANGTLIQTLSGSGLTRPRGVGFYPNAQVIFIAQFHANRPLQRWVIPPPVQIPILGYHNVIPSWNASHSLMISPDNFKDQLDFLIRHGYNVVSLDEIYEHIMYGNSLPNKPIAITFDDNYEGITIYGVPLLLERNMPGTIFTHTDFVGFCNVIGCRGTWEQLRANEATGLIKIESHTVRHANLNTISMSSAFSENIISKRAIELNIPNKICNYLAYPQGGDFYTSASFSPRGSIPTIAAQAGYLASFSYAGGFSSRTTPIHNLARVSMLGSDTLNAFKTKIGFTGTRHLLDPYIVNNDGGSDGTFGTSGSWSTGTNVTGNFIGCYGSNFLFASGGTGTITATFRPLLDTTGWYRVYAWWNSDTDRASNAPYTINSLSGSTTIRVNQRNNGFQWNYLGLFHFAQGNNGTIILSNNADGVVTADAIKLEYYSEVAVDLSSFEQVY